MFLSSSTAYWAHWLAYIIFCVYYNIKHTNNIVLVIYNILLLKNFSFSPSRNLLLSRFLFFCAGLWPPAWCYNNTILSYRQFFLHLSAVQNCVPSGPVPKLAIFGYHPVPGDYFRLWEKLGHLHWELCVTVLLMGKTHIMGTCYFGVLFQTTALFISNWRIAFLVLTQEII